MNTSLLGAFTAGILALSASFLAGNAVLAQTKPGSAKPNSAAVQKATIAVTEAGYEPSTLKLKVGIPAKVTFIRKSDKTCGTEVLLPGYKIKKDLPLNKPVVVSFTPKKAGTYGFTCGMQMLKGSIIVQ